MDAQNGNTKKVMAALAVLLLIAVMVFGSKALSHKSNTSGSPAAVQGADTKGSGKSSSATSEPSMPAAGDSGATATAGHYKDGTYQATGQYRSPGGQQAIKVSVTLKDGKVADTSAEAEASDDTSRDYQGEFIAGYKSQVVGKSLDEIKLSKVSGSSLTSQGFNDALQQIKSQADV